MNRRTYTVSGLTLAFYSAILTAFFLALGWTSLALAGGFFSAWCLVAEVAMRLTKKGGTR